ncbi:DNA mismatch repair protein MutT [Actinoplanes philippinensis]|uniref:8-oxo-dGTP pyrophosphatase MutT, NUDIX family n=1 Tax=Actinoplanes philippinensis TaxID=35752 RepID=A0A1I2I1N7_9ACTN|nr:NUDIX domain-containing protein [Actinoplanes philippinensis]GIE78863.1 DNA mismatch repair protein MutT [Actinoplanes philippinensis]SFF34826.1 8-oxo-dGTP pyrophosphatase MutT, NUDIX family [Actinoplanes philippinensis]
MGFIDKIAWIQVADGAVLSTRSVGRDVFYLPGGKREPGESDVDTLVREVREELSVTIVAGSAAHLGTFEAQAHGHPDGTIVRMACYTADFDGVLRPDNEIEEIVWLTGADRDRVSPVDQLVFDELLRAGLLRQRP